METANFAPHKTTARRKARKNADKPNQKIQQISSKKTENKQEAATSRQRGYTHIYICCLFFAIQLIAINKKKQLPVRLILPLPLQVRRY